MHVCVCVCVWRAHFAGVQACVCVCVCVSVCVWRAHIAVVRAYVCVCVHKEEHLYAGACACACVRACVRGCLRVCADKHAHVLCWVRACMSAHVCAFAGVCIIA